MTFKINISNKEGKTYKLETESESLVGKELGDTFLGQEISPDLTGYELKITGASDKAGFPAIESVDGITLNKVLLSYEKGMKKRPKHEGKRAYSNKTPKGLRLRKTVRGKIISPAIIQINTQVLKEGAKKLEHIFKKEAPAEAQ